MKIILINLAFQFIAMSAMSINFAPLTNESPLLYTHRIVLKSIVINPIWDLPDHPNSIRGRERLYDSIDGNLVIMATFRFNDIELLQVEVNNTDKYDGSNHIFPKGTTLTIVSIAGLENRDSIIYYQMDGSPKMPYLKPLRLIAKGVHTIQMHGIDILGSECLLGSIKVKIVE